MSYINEAKKKAKEIIAQHEHVIKGANGEDVLIVSHVDMEFELFQLLKKVAKLQEKLNEK
jgi:protein-arginine kinase